MNLLRSIARKFGYDAVDTTNTRRRPSVRVTHSEDGELPGNKRQHLIATSRDVHRNFTIAGWMIRKHLDYVATMSFQSRSGDRALDQRIEELMRWWSRPQNCDVAGRHSLQRMIRIAEERRIVDGDILAMKLSDGYLQWIEGDRIRTPDKLPDGLGKDELVHGVQIDRYGAARAYCVCKRAENGQYEYERLLRAGYCNLLGYYDRFDQVRGISPLAPAINVLRDVYESCDYQLAKAKVAALFGLKFTRESLEPLDGAADGEESSYELNLSKGPFTLDLEPGDNAEILESKNPSVEWQQFASTMIQVALKALDIPYSFFAENFSNYSGSRQALLQYEQSVKTKRQDLVDVLDSITAWRLRLFIEDGHLALPGGLQLGDLRWEWVGAGLPWIQPVQEVNADVLSINSGLNSRQDILKAQGKDFYDVADQLASEAAYLKSMGLNPEATPISVVESKNE